MIGLVGIRDISSIQDSLSINSFTKNGVSRGYSAVISSDGSYIVNIERTVYLNKKENFFERVDNGKSTELTSQEIYNKMEAGEEFSFSHTDEEGVNRIVYCKPFVEEEIPWYFLLTVESTVFSEQNRSFLGMSLAMLINVVLVIIVVLLLLTISQNKVIRANAEARARSTFLANMSHEIRTPLNGIIGMIYLLEKDIDSGQDREVIRQRLYKARNTAEYLLSLINNILDISKLQAGKVEIKNEIISPEIIIDDIWSMQRSNIENRGVEFIVKKEISEPWIKGDELIIKQVLLNILSNAAKFTAAGGKVTLSVVQEKERDNRIATCFICEDTGCGMSEDFLEHIWDSFSQERSNNSESIKGTGLGMAISKLLIDAVGGEIRVKSKQGVGSTFYVTVHSEIAKRGPEYHPEIMDYAGQMMTEEKSATILIAEDNELNAEILSEILESEGFSVILATNGQDAVEKFRESKEGEIGLILMDMQMPVMDGCTASAEIRSMNRPDAEKVLIFACTANNFEEDRKRAQESGMNDFLSKPIDVKELFKKIGNSNITIVRKEL
jgi:signal transduction histidine kinase/CheY-like chemotaxis protein